VLVQSFEEAWEFEEMTAEYLEEQIKLVMDQIFYMSETITDFPAADRAGSTRILICAGATIFTHAGNLTVQGAATYTAAAGEVVIVTATTTTAFHIKPPGIATVAQMTKLDNVTALADISYTALAVADLSDTATPSVLTTAETTNKLISNYKSSGADHVFTMCAAHTKGNIIFIIGDEFQVNLDPDTDDLFYLNGTAMAANENIVNSADTLGQTIVGMCANINGTLRWVFNSSDADWVEATP
jgi:hypothetical protein